MATVWRNNLNFSFSFYLTFKKIEKVNIDSLLILVWAKITYSLSIIVKVEISRTNGFFWNRDHYIQKHDFGKNVHNVLKYF